MNIEKPSKLRRRESLPKWFRLEEFNILKRFGACEWYSVVSDLMYFKDEFILGRDWKPEDIDFEKLVEHLLDPVVSSDGFYGSGTYTVNGGTFQFGSVGALLVGTLANMAREFDRFPNSKQLKRIYEHKASIQRKKAIESVSRTGLNLEELHRVASMPFFLALQENRQGLGEALPITSNRAIVVDMNLPDNLILEDFKAWLKASRGVEIHRAAPKVYAENDFAQWCDDAYVPLTMLLMWSEITGVELSNTLLSEALFPSRRMIGESHVRRTIKPGREKWLCKETADALGAQSAKLAASRMSTNEEE